MEPKSNEEKIKVFVRIKPFLKHHRCPKEERISNKIPPAKPAKKTSIIAEESSIINSLDKAIERQKSTNQKDDMPHDLLSSPNLVFEENPQLAEENIGIDNKLLCNNYSQRDIDIPELPRSKPKLDRSPKINEPRPIVKINKNHIKNSKTGDIFEFDSVFDENQYNEDLFKKIILENMDFIISGNNFSVFMYGQTSSGKTHTMKGYKPLAHNVEDQNSVDSKLNINCGSIPYSQIFNGSKGKFQMTKPTKFLSPQNSAKKSEVRDSKFHNSPSTLNHLSSKQKIFSKNLDFNDRSGSKASKGSQNLKQILHSFGDFSKDDGEGLVQLTFRELFRRLKSRSDCFFKMSISYVELYNENIYDLLSGQSYKQSLELFENENGKINIKNLTEPQVTNLVEAMNWYKKGESTRSFATTAQNHNSSRSHVVLKINLEIRYKARPFKSYNSNIVLADLAGSEALSRDTGKEIRFREGTLINKSLLALSNVVMKLRNGTSHISFRESKLTRILQPVLSGNSRTAVVCTVSCLPENLLESISTLRFGVLAKGIKLTIRSEADSKADGNFEAGLLEELNSKIKTSEEGVEKLLIEKNQLQEEKRDLEIENQYLKEKIDGSAQEIESLELLVKNLEHTNIELRNDFETINKEITRSQKYTLGNGQHKELIEDSMKANRDNESQMIPSNYERNIRPLQNDSKIEIKRPSFSKFEEEKSIIDILGVLNSSKTEREKSIFKKAITTVGESEQREDELNKSFDVNSSKILIADNSINENTDSLLISKLCQKIEFLTKLNSELKQDISKLKMQLTFKQGNNNQKTLSQIQKSKILPAQKRFMFLNKNSEDCGCEKKLKKINNGLSEEELIKRSQDLEQKLSKMQKEEGNFSKREAELRLKLSQSTEKISQLTSIIKKNFVSFTTSSSSQFEMQ
jgi:hypothetical protein